MSYISDGTTTLEVPRVQDRAHTRPTGNIIHTIPGSDQVDVTLRVSGPRRGQLQVSFDTYADALACDAMHAAGAVLTFVDTDYPAASMTYVVAGGEVSVTLDTITLTRAACVIPFQEVAG